MFQLSTSVFFSQSNFVIFLLFFRFSFSAVNLNNFELLHCVFSTLVHGIEGQNPLNYSFFKVSIILYYYYH